MVVGEWVVVLVDMNDAIIAQYSNMPVPREGESLSWQVGPGHGEFGIHHGRVDHVSWLFGVPYIGESSYRAEVVILEEHRGSTVGAPTV